MDMQSTDIKNETDKVCIIGAGSSGLAAAKTFAERGIPFDCLERENDIGGLWNETTGTGVVYDTTYLVSSRRYTGFEDFPMPEEYPTYPSHREALAYLRDYAQNFGLLDRIEFNTAVERVERTAKGWLVYIEGVRPRLYRALVIATGHHDVPRLPEIPGKFSGEVMHSRDYRSVKQLMDKVVVVVGAGNSACDIVVDATSVSRAVYQSMRRGTYFVPKFMLGRPTDGIVSFCEKTPMLAKFRNVLYTRVEAAASMMIVYATEPGNVALDGTGRNSPFTRRCCATSTAKARASANVMIAVRNDVLSATGGKQRPFESASLTGQFFFKPKPQETSAKSSTTSDEIAALREQIAKLQADQGALLKSQQEQLAALQKRLAEEAAESGTTSRVVGVEPAKSNAADTDTASTPAPTPSFPPSDAAPPADGTKVAATESTGAEEPAPDAAKTEAPLPEAPTRQELAQDILVELSKLSCYFGAINGNWGARSRAALSRFNRHARLDLPLDEPEQASLDALKEWKGSHCPLEKAVPPRIKQRPVVVVPRKQVPPRKAVRAAPPKAPPVQAVRPRPQPQDHGSDEVRELQRAFPSTAWPGQ